MSAVDQTDTMTRANLNDPEIVDAICNRLASGEGINEICADRSMPAESTVYLRMHTNEEFRSRIARAREAQQEYEADRMVALADAATVEDYNVVKLRIWARQWRAAKLHPKKYGDKLDVTAQTQVTHVVDEVDLAALSSDERDMLRQVAQTLLARKAQALEDKREEEA